MVKSAHNRRRLSDREAGRTPEESRHSQRHGHPEEERDQPAHGQQYCSLCNPRPDEHKRPDVTFCDTDGHNREALRKQAQAMERQHDGPRPYEPNEPSNSYERHEITASRDVRSVDHSTVPGVAVEDFVGDYVDCRSVEDGQVILVLYTNGANEVIGLIVPPSLATDAAHRHSESSNGVFIGEPEDTPDGATFERGEGPRGDW